MCLCAKISKSRLKALAIITSPHAPLRGNFSGAGTSAGEDDPVEVRAARLSVVDPRPVATDRAPAEDGLLVARGAHLLWPGARNRDMWGVGVELSG